MTNKYHILVASLVASFLVSQDASAQNSRTTKKVTKVVQKKTVGDLLTQTHDSSRSGKLQMSKTDTSLPSSNLGFKEQAKNVNLDTVKPPRSSTFMRKDSNTQQFQYEKVLDQQIRELYKLTQKFKNSPSRGELWLRLAEIYVEKAGLIDARKQDEYDARLRDFQSGKSKVKPNLEIAEAREYNRKAVQLYEWFQRDFPRDPKMSQALFFLGYNYFELGDVKKGAEYYETLTRGYPNSPFVGEAHFALGEYYFENEKWTAAYKEYAYIIKEKKHRMHTFALYKGAWSLFRMGKTQQATNYLEYIIKSGQKDAANAEAGLKSVNNTRLEGEAMRDLVVFYAETGDPAKAVSYFRSLVGKGDASPYLERLAYQYSDRGNKEASREVFKRLIAQNPTTAKAFDYQYQVVQNYFYAKNTSLFRSELYNWVKDYGPTSQWYGVNKANKELIENSYKLRETTLRNYVLQQHQTAQNSRAEFSQTSANDGYQLYLKEFSDSALSADMHFYYGELLYDMGKFDEALVQYKWVTDNAPQNKFYAKASQNLILAAEKGIPTDKEMQARVGQSLDPLPLDPRVDRFIKAGMWFTEKFPNSEKTPEIKFRVGRLYYQSNHFDEATKHFKEIVKRNPESKQAEYSANLLLDIYNLKKDYVGLEKTGIELLAVPSIANSKAGADIRGVLEKSSFKRAQDLEVGKRYAESAQVFENFAKENPKSDLAINAMFNAGVNYERAGMAIGAIGAYQNILNSKDPKATALKPQARRFLAKQYQDSAQFEEAARLYTEVAQESPSDPLAPNMIYNAAVLYEALGRSSEAIKAYNNFIKINKKKSENVEVIYNMAQIHRKAGQVSAAVSRYMEYVETGGNDREKVVESAYWVTDLSRKVNAITRSKEWAQKTLAIQKKFAPNQKGVGASYAAKIKLMDATPVFNEFKAITFPKNPQRQKEAADRKLALLNQLSSRLVEIIKFDSGEEIVSSLVILGEANQNMAQTLINAPLPSGLNEEETKQYKAGVEKFAEPFTAKVRESMKLAVDRGWELEVYNDAYRTAYSYMSKVDPANYYNGAEASSDVRLVNWMGQ